MRTQSCVRQTGLEGATTTPMKAAATMTMTGTEMIAAKMEAGVKMKEAICWTCLSLQSWLRARGDDEPATVMACELHQQFLGQRVSL